MIRLTYRDLLHLYVGSEYYRRGTRNIIVLSALLWVSWMTLIAYAASSGIEMAGIAPLDGAAAFYVTQGLQSALFVTLFGALTWLGHRFASPLYLSKQTIFRLRMS